MIPDWVSQDPDLTWIAKGLYGWLARLQNGGVLAYPKQSTLAEKMGVTRKSIQLAIAQLQAKGVLKVWKVTEDGKQHNTYTLLPALNEQLQRAHRRKRKDAESCVKNTHPTIREELALSAELLQAPLPRRGPETHSSLMAKANRRARESVQP